MIDFDSSAGTFNFIALERTLLQLTSTFCYQKAVLGPL